MNVYFNSMRVAIGFLLFAAFLMLFWWLAKERLMTRFVAQTYSSIEAAARHRSRENRKQLTLLQEGDGFWNYLEKRLVYSGIPGRFPWVTPEIWVIVNLAASAAGYFIVFLFSRRILWALAAAVLLQVLRYLWESWLIRRNDRAVNENLMKFLDFLGNYSITAGEVTGILNQISKYLDDPLRRVLDECYYEAQTSGDASLALLSMAEKIRHPRFKELVRNIEISVRYSADFTVLVQNSRRAIREHMKSGQERKAMINEALINMILLAAMSFVVLLMVEKLLGVPIRDVLLESLPGRIGLGIICVILLCMYHQIQKLDA